MRRSEAVRVDDLGQRGQPLSRIHIRSHRGPVSQRMGTITWSKWELKKNREEVDAKETIYLFQGNIVDFLFIFWARICKVKMSRVTSVCIHSGASSNKTAAWPYDILTPWSCSTPQAMAIVSSSRHSLLITVCASSSCFNTCLLYILHYACVRMPGVSVPIHSECRINISSHYK